MAWHMTEFDQWILGSIIGLVAVAIGYAIVYTLHAGRNARMRRYAKRHGFTYARRADQLLERWQFAPFTLGTRRVVEFVVFGTHRGYQFASLRFKRDIVPAEIAKEANSLNDFHVIVLRLPTPWPDTVLGRAGLHGDSAHGTASRFREPQGNPPTITLADTWELSCADLEYRKHIPIPALTAWCTRPDTKYFAVRLRGYDAFVMNSGWPKPARILPIADALIDLLAILPPPSPPQPDAVPWPDAVPQATAEPIPDPSQLSMGQPAIASGDEPYREHPGTR